MSLVVMAEVCAIWQDATALLSRPVHEIVAMMMATMRCLEIRSKDIVCKGVVSNVYGDRTCDHQGTEIRRGRHGNTVQPCIFQYILCAVASPVSRRQRDIESIVRQPSSMNLSLTFRPPHHSSGDLLLPQDSSGDLISTITRA